MSSSVFQRSKGLTNKLLRKLSPGPERGGLILKGGKLVEVQNICSEPEEGFLPDAADLIPHLPNAVGTWHTHPGASANLSVEDAETFVSWPDWLHAIVGEDGVRWYAVKNGAAINAP